jgi:hypothetical protein
LPASDSRFGDALRWPRDPASTDFGRSASAQTERLARMTAGRNLLGQEAALSNDGERNLAGGVGVLPGNALTLGAHIGYK